MKKIFSVILVLGLLGFWGLNFIGYAQELEKTIRVVGASEDFGKNKNLTDKRKEIPKNFFQMTATYFAWACATQDNLLKRLNAKTVRTNIAWVAGVNSKRPAIVLCDFGIESDNGQIIKSKLAIVCYIDELEKTIELYDKLFRKYCKFQYNDKFLFLLPKAKKTAQKFVDDLKRFSN